MAVELFRVTVANWTGGIIETASTPPVLDVELAVSDGAVTGVTLWGTTTPNLLLSASTDGLPTADNAYPLTSSGINLTLPTSTTTAIYGTFGDAATVGNLSWNGAELVLATSLVTAYTDTSQTT